MKPEITAIGRLLKKKGDAPRIHKVIAVKSDGQVRTIVNKEMT
jgi:hypothetical protein